MGKEQLEQTLVLIKPDALKNSITGFIFSQFSEFHTGARFAATKVVNVNRFLAEEHYAEHKGKVFYEPLLEYITGASHYPEQEKWKRRVIAIVFQGRGVLEKIRSIAGPTDPHEAREKRPGCIRALGTMVPIRDADGNVIGSRMDNLIHTSATFADAEREIKLWFLPHDIPPLMRAYPTEVCSTYYYYKDGRLYDVYEPGSSFLLAPGDVVWKSDLEILHAYARGEPGRDRLNTVVAKYLINKS
ncbi:MAG: nucleoside-diphosphate kinase [Phycisphaerae bacterium]|nr:nucleoside-diphosphate kinase [Phycisphaerae bacterium]MDD5380626.1 nucleoside-diphosphate kinase [Phycisphaerae bacterium]